MDFFKPKEFKPVGICQPECKGDMGLGCNCTYADDQNKSISAPFTAIDLPYNSDILNAKNVIEIGCGMGRNVQWWMENTKANYYGVDPNKSLTDLVLRNDTNFNKVFKDEWLSRVHIANSFDDAVKAQKFDVVVSTFVFQHIGYRTINEMNISDITKEIKKQTKEGTVWFLYEHEWEEKWLSRWLNENDFTQKARIYRSYAGIPELTKRQAHDLILIKE